MELVHEAVTKTPETSHMTARELRKLPKNERSRLVRAMVKQAAPYYEPGGALLVEGNEDVIDY